MKRPREATIEPLGATEFAATLNGEDPNAIYRCLKRFARIVRRQRQQAFSASAYTYDDGHESSDNDLDEGDDVDGGDQKRVKKDEAWKEDLANYNVPFVGTAVSSAKDLDAVIVGEWPTGLLKAYLVKSPLAVEINGDELIPGQSRLHTTLLKNKKGKLSRAIYKAYLQVVSEVITAAIPVELITREYLPVEQTLDVNSFKQQSTKEMSHGRFLAEFLKRRLPGLLLALKAETNHGKDGSVGGQSSLSSILLHILARLSMTSVENCRHVARSIQTSVSERLARCFVKPTRLNDGDSQSNEASSSSAHEKALNLARVFLEWEDPAVLSIVCHRGARDRKLSPGLVFLALKEISIKDSDTAELRVCSGLYRTLARFLGVLYRLLSEGSVGKRQLTELLSRDSVHNLCRLVAHAPPLMGDDSFTSVMDAVDSYSNLTDLERLGVMARRILFLLLANKLKSPLLRSLDAEDDMGNSHSIVVRTVIMLLDTQKGLDMQKFIVYIVKSTPQLFAGIFQSLSLPDPRDAFQYIRRVNFVSRMIRDGPSVSACDGSGTQEKKAVDRLERILSMILPTCLRKQQLNRGLQQTNALVIAETLKVLHHALQRLRNYSDDRKVAGADTVADRMLPHLPDIQTLVGIIPRLRLSDGSSNAVILGYCCSVMHTFLTLYPQSTLASAFEWLTILHTDNPTAYTASTALAQSKLLDLLSEICQQKEYSHSLSADSLRNILALVTSSRSYSVYVKSRRLAVQILKQIAAFSVSSRADVEYELQCWVDCVTEGAMEDFITLVLSVQDGLKSKMTLAKLLSSVGYSLSLADPSVSRLLSSGLAHLATTSSNFVSLLCDVAGRCLLFQMNPLPLATLIISHGNPLKETHFSCLHMYAECIVSFAKTSGEYRTSRFCELAKILFPKAPLPLGCRDIACRRRNASYRLDVEVMLRRSVHLMLSDVALSGAPSPSLMFRQLYPLSIKLQLCCGLSLERIGKAYPDALIAQLLIQTGLPPSGAGADSSACFAIKRRPLKMQENQLDLASEELVTELLFLHATTRCLSKASVIERSTLIMEMYETRIYSSNLRLVWLRLAKDYLSLIDVSDSLDVLANVHPFADVAVHVWLSCDDIGVAQEIEKVFCALLSESAPAFWTCTLHSTMSKFDRRAILKRCVVKTSFQASYLLPALIKTDSAVFGAVVLELITADDDLQRYMNLGLLDAAIRETLSCPLAQSYPEALHLIEASTTRRMTTFLDEWKRHDDLEFEMLSTTLDACWRFEYEGLTDYCPLVAVLERVFEERLLMRTNDIVSAVDRQRWYRLLQFGMNLHNHLNCQPTSTDFSFPRSIFNCSFQLLVQLAAPANVNAEPNRFYVLFQSLGDLIHRCREEEWLQASPSRSKLVQLVKSAIDAGVDATAIDFLLLAADLTEELVQICEAHSSEESVLTQSMQCIFDQVTRHERFHATITACQSSSTGLKFAVLQILNVCVTSSRSITAERSVMQSLLEAFNAGVTAPDLLLRTIIFGCIEQAEADGSYFMDQLRWGALPRQDSSGWDWFPDAIDMQRLYSTLRNFPIHDTNRKEAKSLWDGGEESGTGGSCWRYSPCFLLSLTLAAMIDSGDDAVLLHRLCDRGCHSLALASLASNCPDVRRLAVAVLGRFLQVLHSDDARTIASWRERPQVAMLLKAVHQGLAIKRFHEKWEDGSVRKIPGISAIFLAKASLILAKPNDRMFPAINRYFLRAEDDHGAFQDLYRLPGFIALFCSTADEPGQAIAEKAWSLRLINDGFLDEDCYKPSASCHALELILGSIDSFRFHTCSDQDITVALSSLKKMLLNGGERCVSHIVGRLGLLYWARAMLVARPMLKGLSGGPARRAFLELIVAGVEVAGTVLSPEEMADACIDLAQQVVGFCLLCKDESVLDKKLISLGCAVLNVVRRVGRDSRADSKVCIFVADGLCIRLALDFLGAVDSHDEKVDALFSLCALPMSNSMVANELSYAVFCDSAVAILASARRHLTLQDGMVDTVLNRVQALMSASSGNLPSIQAGALITNLCELRMVCSTDASTRATYFEVLRVFNQRTDLSTPWRVTTG